MLKNTGSEQSKRAICFNRSFSTSERATCLHERVVSDKDVVQFLSRVSVVENSCVTVNIEAFEPATCDSEPERGAEGEEAHRVVVYFA